MYLYRQIFKIRRTSGEMHYDDLLSRCIAGRIKCEIGEKKNVPKKGDLGRNGGSLSVKAPLGITIDALHCAVVILFHCNR